MPTIKQVISDILLEEFEIDISQMGYATKLSALNIDADSTSLIGKMICRQYNRIYIPSDWETIVTLGDFTIVINRAPHKDPGSVLDPEEILYEEEALEPRESPEPIYDSTTGVQIATMVPALTESEVVRIKDEEDPFETYLESIRERGHRNRGF